MRRYFERVRSYGELVLWSHSIFSFSFLVLAALTASGGIPNVRKSLLLVAAFLGGRTSANAFNRLADRDYDAANERTASRQLPTGKVSAREAAGIAAFSFALLAVAAFLLRPICFVLLPVAGALIFGYSYTKRFTRLSHLVLGVACACAPAGAWIAVRGSLGLEGAILCGADALWVTGFDVVYAIQDIEFDRRTGLRSIPARFGERISLMISGLCHAAASALLIVFGLLAKLSLAYFTGVAAVALILAWAAAAARKDYARNVLFASYSANQIVSVILLATSLVEFLA